MSSMLLPFLFRKEKVDVYISELYTSWFFQRIFPGVCRSYLLAITMSSFHHEPHLIYNFYH